MVFGRYLPSPLTPAAAVAHRDSIVDWTVDIKHASDTEQIAHQPVLHPRHSVAEPAIDCMPAQRGYDIARTKRKMGLLTTRGM